MQQVSTGSITVIKVKYTFRCVETIPLQNLSLKDSTSQKPLVQDFDADRMGTES